MNYFTATVGRPLVTDRADGGQTRGDAKGREEERQANASIKKLIHEDE